MRTIWVSGHQLELVGIEEARRRTAELASTKAVRTRALNRIDATHDLLSALPGQEDLTFTHSGLCQTFLPHARPESNQSVWRRESGRFTLMVMPGLAPEDGETHRPRDWVPAETDYIGVPYGAKARLIMFHIQSVGLQSRTVPLGKNLSAFLRSLGLHVSGGARGTIAQVREQCMRIARCNFSLQWTEVEPSGNRRQRITDTKIVDDMETFWNATSDNWSATIELSEKFHSNLLEHAVPLDKRSIALLSGNSLALDLYALFAYRLPKLRKDLLFTWGMIQTQVGSEYSETKQLARKIRDVMPEVIRAYPHARVSIERHGLLLKESKPSVPHTMVSGYRLIKSPAGG